MTQPIGGFAPCDAWMTAIPGQNAEPGVSKMVNIRKNAGALWFGGNSAANPWLDAACGSDPRRSFGRLRRCHAVGIAAAREDGEGK